MADPTEAAPKSRKKLKTKRTKKSTVPARVALEARLRRGGMAEAGIADVLQAFDAGKGMGLDRIPVCFYGESYIFIGNLREKLVEGVDGPRQMFARLMRHRDGTRSIVVTCERAAEPLVPAPAPVASLPAAAAPDVPASGLAQDVLPF